MGDVPRRRLRKDWWRSSEGFTTVFGSITLTAAAIAILAGVGTTTATFDLGDGSAWLASNETGEVMLVDGATGQGTARVEVPGAAGGKIRVEHKDGHAYAVVDEPSGTRVLYRLDDATLASGAKRDVAPSQRLVRGGDRAYLVDTDSGEVRQIDPDHLTPVGDPLKFDPPINGAADAEGRLVVVERSKGNAYVVVDSRTSEATTVGSGDDDVDIRSVGSVPTVVNLRSRKVYAFKEGKSTTVDIPPAEGELVVPAETEGSQLVLLARNGSKGSIVSVDVETTKTTVAPLAVDVSEVEPPLVSDGAVYLVRPSDGKVSVVDAASGATRREIDPGLGKGRGVLDTFVKDGMLWINNPEGSKAVVVRSDGEQRKVDKYDDTVPVIEPTVPTQPLPDPVTPSTVPVPQPQPGGPARDPVRIPGGSGGPGGGAPTGPDDRSPSGPGPDRSGGTAPPPSTTTAPGGPTTTDPPPVANAPASPVSFSATASAASISLAWGAPANGGSPIEEYLLTCSPDCGPGRSVPLSVPASALALPIDGLANGTRYTFELAARNRVGTGPSATASATPVSDLPDAPSEVTAAENGNGTVRVTWTPAGDQSLTVVGFRIVATSSNAAVSPARVSFTVSDPSATSFDTPVDAVGYDDDNAPDVTFRVVTLATKDAATVESAPSAASNPVDPYNVPLWPTGAQTTSSFRHEPYDLVMDMSWPAAIGRGRAVTSYRACLGDCPTPYQGAANSTSWHQRDSRDVHEPKVWATNDAGDSAVLATPSTATMPTVPPDIVWNAVEWDTAAQTIRADISPYPHTDSKAVTCQVGLFLTVSPRDYVGTGCSSSTQWDGIFGSVPLDPGATSATGWGYVSFRLTDVNGDTSVWDWCLRPGASGFARPASGSCAG